MPLVGLRFHACQAPPSRQLLAVQRERERARRERRPGIAVRLPGAAVPKQHDARPVVARCDHALVIGVVQAMVTDLDGEPALARDEARAARDRPTLQDAANSSRKS